MKQLKHWQDPVTAVLGAWLICSPWVPGIRDDMTALGNMVIVGVLLLTAALGAIFLPIIWEEWTEIVLGLWLVVSPWVAGFSANGVAKASAILTGLAVLVLALWAMQDEGSWLRDRTVH
jgi:hypothetical protein